MIIGFDWPSSSEEKMFENDDIRRRHAYAISSSMSFWLRLAKNELHGERCHVCQVKVKGDGQKHSFSIGVIDLQNL